MSIASYIAYAQFSQQMDNTSKVLSTNPDKVGVWPNWPEQVRARQDKEVCWSYINIHFLVPVCSWDFSPIQIQLKIEMTTISTSASGDLAWANKIYISIYLPTLEFDST